MAHWESQSEVYHLVVLHLYLPASQGSGSGGVKGSCPRPEEGHSWRRIGPPWKITHPRVADGRIRLGNQWAGSKGLIPLLAASTISARQTTRYFEEQLSAPDGEAGIPQSTISLRISHQREWS
jgi:hypothetical protein